MQLKDKKRYCGVKVAELFLFKLRVQSWRGWRGDRCSFPLKLTHLLLLFADPPKKSQKRIE
jgi:hypothetical protein